MDKILKRLKELADRAKELRSLPSDEYTEEIISELEANTEERKRLNKQLEVLRNAEELDAVETRTINPPATAEGQIVVQDQPIYRGTNALGQQMVDIASVVKTGNADARARLEQVINRETVLFEKRAAGTGGHIQGIASDGGWLLQGETSIDLMTNGFNNSEVISRCARRDIGMAQFVEVIGIDETSRVAGSRGGGVRVYTDSELGLMTQSKTKLNKIRLEPKKLTGMYFASDEILANAPLLQGEMTSLFNEEFAFKVQDLVINGNGAGQMLGLLAAGCTVSQAKETGQTATTIVFENLVKMKSRFMSRSNSAVWVANRDVEPQLFALSLPVGTGGSVMPVYIPSQNVTAGVAGTLMGIPIVFIEQCATLGTVGDIMLCDFAQYIVATRGGINSASSIHLKFDYNQTTFRFVFFVDGQPRLQSAITPYKGSNTVSPFVSLATRS